MNLLTRMENIKMFWEVLKTTCLCAGVIERHFCVWIMWQLFRFLYVCVYKYIHKSRSSLNRSTGFHSLKRAKKVYRVKFDHTNLDLWLRRIVMLSVCIAINTLIECYGSEERLISISIWCRINNAFYLPQIIS